MVILTIGELYKREVIKMIINIEFLCWRKSESIICNILRNMFCPIYFNFSNREININIFAILIYCLIFNILL
jgi:hypothetical protein